MRLIVVLVLMTLAVRAWAGWMKFAESDWAIFYVDQATVEKYGGFRSVWMLSDFKKQTLDGVSSVRKLSEFDCAGKRSRSLRAITFSGSMGSGTILGAVSQYSQWGDIKRGTADEALMRLVCP
jgi:Surface-adhesin protein E